LSNDTPVCDTITVAVVNQPTNGTVVLNPDNTVSYTPALDFCGIDSFSYELCNPIGCDTAWVFVNVICPTLCTIPDAVNDNATTDVNIETTIAATDNDTSNCPLASEDVVTQPTNGTVTDNDDGSFSYTPETDFCGVDSFSYSICNAAGCDTAWVLITVTCPPNLGPIANYDFQFSETPNAPVVINILGNDEPNASPDSITIVITLNPTNGVATIDNQNQLVYIPKNNFCGNDTLIYTLCNPYGCDTALVVIKIKCSELTVFNGLSINGDGFNDVWVIQGIDDFPNNKVSVFNRWGNLVYEASKYLNTWEGTWQDQPLPSGTYFYLIDDGEGRNYTGWLYLTR